MDKLFTLFVCSFHLLVASVSSRDHRSHTRSQMAFTDSGSYYGSCCFVDLFCYVSCFSSDYSLRSLVPYQTELGRFHTSETRHRRRHGHHRQSESSFRTRREIDDNILWQKLRHNFIKPNSGKMDRDLDVGT